jgi:hypothetical protein
MRIKKKFKEGVFVGPQIINSMYDIFDEILKSTEMETRNTQKIFVAGLVS